MEDPVRDALERFTRGEPALDDGRVLVRAGLAFVFVWLGADKFVHTSYWPMWVPDALSFLATSTGLYVIGVAEIVLGLALLAGVRERAVALTTSVYLAAIVASQGVVPVVRDMGLLGAALYLALTAPGPAGRTIHLGWALPRGEAARRAAAIVGLAALVAAVGTAVVVGLPGSGPGDGTGSLLTFETPENGTTVDGEEVPLRVALAPRVHDLGLDHVHIKVDRQVVDALYFDDGRDAVETTLDLDPGSRLVGAYLAYIDHVEHENSWTEIRVDVR